MNDPGSEHSEDFALAGLFLESRSEVAFRALYRRHTPALYGIVLRLLGGKREDADDVVQDTWVRAVERLSTFRWEASLRTWLTAIAINCVRNRYRRGRAREASDIAEVAEMPASPAVERTIDAVDMERAIESLPAGYREVIVLHDVYGYTHDEVGEILDISSGTSKSQLARARRALRRRLGQTGDENHERQTS